MRPTAALAALIVLAAAPAFASSPAGEGRQQRRITASTAYVQAPTLTAPISRDYSFAGVLVVEVCFDVPDAKLRAKVEKMQPRIIDAMRTALAEYAHSRFRAGTAPDADLIARTLQQATDRAVGEKGAQLLLANVMVQNGR